MDEESEKMNLKEKIRNQMMASHSNSLDKNFELARNFINITQQGKVDVLVKDKVNGNYKILLYLIGKLYSKEGDMSKTDCVETKEIIEELGMRQGTFGRNIKELKDKKRIEIKVKGGKNSYRVPINIVERVLNEVERETMKKKGDKNG